MHGSSNGGASSTDSVDGDESVEVVSLCLGLVMASIELQNRCKSERKTRQETSAGREHQIAAPAVRSV
jgi:uncharacterized membrane protein